MNYQHIRNAREGFVDMRSGDKLIRLESRLIGIAFFFYMLIGADAGFATSLIAGLLLVLIVPWIVGLIPVIAMVFAVVFSVAWAVLVYFIVGALANVPVGVICALIVLIMSFYLHKIFAGIGFSSITKILIDSVQQISENTAGTEKTHNIRDNIKINQIINVEKDGRIMNNIFSKSHNQISVKAYCHNCGTKLNGTEKFCGNCGTKL